MSKYVVTTGCFHLFNMYRFFETPDYDVFRSKAALILSSLVLCFAQCLAHVEAFIDFSEDELIEDGVLNQGTNTLCPRC